MNIEWAKITSGLKIEETHIYLNIDNDIWDFGLTDVYHLTYYTALEFDNPSYIDIDLKEALGEILIRNDGIFPLLKHKFEYGTKQ